MPRSITTSPVKRAAVFLDRDGTLNRSIARAGAPFGSPRTLEEFSLLDDAARNCRALSDAGFVLVVATNQPDVGRGIQTQSSVEAMHARLRAAIPELAAIEVSYSAGREGDPVDRRRKPEPGMLLDAAHSLGLDLSRSWMIGDRWRDVDCGQRAGVRTIFLDFHYGERLRAQPDFSAGSLSDAVRIILAHPDTGNLNSPKHSQP
jgi:D-glycero-D-manno-heptose 1,7-bisphosphate phosphatase